MASCIKRGQPLKIVMVLGQSVPYGSEAEPIISGKDGRALSYVDGPRVYSDRVACIKEVRNGPVFEGPTAGLGNYLQDRVDMAMDRNRSPQILSVNISTPGSAVKNFIPDGKGSQWPEMMKHMARFGQIKKNVEAPSAECIGVVLYHGEKDGRNGSTPTATYIKDLETVRTKIENTMKGYINQTSPVRVYVFMNSNSALWNTVQDAFMQVTTSGSRQNKYMLIGPTYFTGRSTPTESVHNSSYGNYIAGVYAARAIYQFQYENRTPDHIRPIKWSRKGNKIVVYYRVPTPPLVRKDVVYPGNNPNQAKVRFPDDGYSVYFADPNEKDGVTPEEISFVLIDGTMVEITCNALSKHSGKVYLTYALWNEAMMLTDYGTTLGGNICDSTTESHLMPTGENFEMRHWMPNHLLELN